MIVLEESIWSDLSCGSRMVVIPIVYVAGFIFMVACIFLSSRLHRWLKGRPQPTRHWMRSRAAVVLGTTILVGVGLVSSVSPSVSRFTTNGKVIVESGCRAASTYTKTIPLDFAKITYKRYVGRRGRSSSPASLVIKGSGYTITLNLNRQKHWPALFRIAPGPVEQFARELREKGQDVPRPLLQLLKWSGA